MMGQVLVEWELCDDLDQLLSRVLVVVELRLEDTEQRYYFFLRAQTVATSAHRRVEEGGRMMVEMTRRKSESRRFVAYCGSCRFVPLLALPPSCPSLQSRDALCAGSSTPLSTPR